MIQSATEVKIKRLDLIQIFSPLVGFSIYINFLWWL